MRKHFTVSQRNLRSWRFHTLLTAAFSHEDLYHLAHNMICKITGAIPRKSTVLLSFLRLMAA